MKVHRRVWLLTVALVLFAALIAWVTLRPSPPTTNTSIHRRMVGNRRSPVTGFRGHRDQAGTFVSAFVKSNETGSADEAPGSWAAGAGQGTTAGRVGWGHRGPDPQAA